MRLTTSAPSSLASPGHVAPSDLQGARGQKMELFDEQHNGFLTHVPQNPGGV